MQFLIDFQNHINNQQITDYLTEVNATVVKIFNSFEKTYLVECGQAPSMDSNIHSYIVRDDDSSLNLLSTLIYVDKSFTTNTLTGEINTVYTSNNNDWWKIFSLYEPNLYSPQIQFDRRGDGITVYVLDSGIKIDHQDLANKDIINLFSFNGDFNDNRGHGTAIASVIVGETCGITNASIKSVKIFENATPTRQSDLVSALDAIYNDYVQQNLDFAIVNCSWQIERNAYLESKIQALIDLGLFFVVAAGNSGTSIDNVTPAAMNDVITVGSYNHNLEPSDFSNYSGSANSLTNNFTNSGQLDGWAPGEQIYVATIDGGFGLTAGTSIAAGIHSAVMAYNIGHYTIPYALDHNLDNNYAAFIQLNFKKHGILDLSDPKYSQSANQISTINDQYPKKTLSNLPSLYKKRSGQKAFVKLIPLPSNVVTIEILNDLPTGFTIDNRGVLRGTFPQVTSVTSSIISIKVTTEQGEVIENDLELINIPSDFDTDNQSTGDPNLDVKIRLLDIYCSINDCTGTTQFCIDDCWDGYCLRDQGKPYGCQVWETYCVCLSDERIKDNIRPLEKTLNSVLQLNGYRFNYLTGTQQHIGVLAQEVEKYYPELVHYRPDGIREVAYGNLTAILIEAIKELKKEIEDLKKSR